MFEDVPPGGNHRREQGALGVAHLPRFLVLIVDDVNALPVPQLGQVEPDVLQRIEDVGQPVPIGESAFEEGLVSARPEEAGLIEGL